MKELLENVLNEIENVDYGYEMGCLISPEFTPLPEYSSVVELIGDNKEDLIKYLGTDRETIMLINYCYDK